MQQHYSDENVVENYYETQQAAFYDTTLTTSFVSFGISMLV